MTNETHRMMQIVSEQVSGPLNSRIRFICEGGPVGADVLSVLSGVLGDLRALSSLVEVAVELETRTISYDRLAKLLLEKKS